MSRFSLNKTSSLHRAPAGQKWRYLSETLHQAEGLSGWRIDRVLITYLDPFINKSLRTVDFRKTFDYRWTGLYFAPGFFRCRSTLRRTLSLWINHRTFRRITGCDGVGILDEGTFPAMQSFFKDRNVFLVPDVTDERLPDVFPDKLIKIRAAAGNRTVIGLIGVLSKRKGLLTYLKAAQALDPDKYFFMIAGHLPIDSYSTAEQREIAGLIDALPRSCRDFAFGYIEDPALVNAYIATCDLLYLCYEGFCHSSGFLTKAAVFRKPVLASEEYCMGERVRQYGLGLTVPEKNIREIVQSIEMLADEEKRRSIVRDDGFERFHDQHNIKSLEVLLHDILEV